MARTRQQRIVENVEILIGFLSFFALVLVVVVIALELSGTNAMTWSLILLGLVLSIWGLLRVRRKATSLPDKPVAGVS